MDPLSITVSVISILEVCLKVGQTLKSLQNGVSLVGTKLGGLLAEVESFSKVLEFVKGTLQENEIEAAFQSTGHVGDHWRNVFICINDGQRTLAVLQVTLVKVAKDVAIFDSARKHLRLTSAAEEITMYQNQIRCYRDTIQLSIQTVIL